EKGEAYGLRAMFMFYLLQAHGGMTADGQLLGIPIVTVPEDGSTNFNIPRNTFAECMKAIYDDCDKALALLPTQYADHTSDADIPAKYKTIGATISEYNRVYGAKFNGRMDGAIVEAFRSKASLLAASPAYASGSGINYEKAADDAAVVLDRIGGIAGIDPTGWTWYTNTQEIDGLANGANPKEVMWRGEKSQNNDWENDNFPPSLYGNGHINPTQNFVDAFPMANGYPINDSRSDYNANSPYTNRDPRLAAYVVYDGTAVGVNDTKINTESTSNTKDGINKVAGTSTRTGYYLRKLLRQDINLDPANTSKQYHYTPRIRFTEIFLNYAEAANEVWGPTGKGSHNYSAFDIIKAIRERAGICKNTEDPYLDECAQDKDKMRELIRNERRIELSFEGFRFWDLRRWKAPLDETAKGIDIATDAQGNVTYKDIDVDTRNYKDYMIYGPVPYSEILKFNELKQNQGW
ncbi:MAG TPA: RagB/SusD family nutrient uptake outer membrane protein, partial [Prevotella sp.]|nr:RagB/SusD family nutrient uptake outer membrane protein [Prevotella sp.]